MYRVRHTPDDLYWSNALNGPCWNALNMACVTRRYFVSLVRSVFKHFLAHSPPNGFRQFIAIIRISSDENRFRNLNQNQSLGADLSGSKHFRACVTRVWSHFLIFQVILFFVSLYFYHSLCPVANEEKQINKIKCSSKKNHSQEIILSNWIIFSRQKRIHLLSSK